jgi:hypothetical protein
MSLFIRYNIMWKRLSVICDRLVVFSGYCGWSRCTGSCNPTTIRSRLRRPLEEIFDIECMLMKIMYTISNWPFFQVLELLYIIQTQHSNHVTTPAAVIGWYTFGWTNYSDTNKDVIIIALCAYSTKGFQQVFHITSITWHPHGHQEETIRHLGRSGQLVQTATSTQKIYWKQLLHKKSLKMPKMFSAAVSQWNSQKDKGSHYYLQRLLNTNPTKNGGCSGEGWTHMFRKGEEFLLH